MASDKIFDNYNKLRELTSWASSKFLEILMELEPDTVREQAEHVKGLLEACKSGDKGDLRLLLSGDNDSSPINISWLSLACSSGQYELVKVLLEMKANIEDSDPISGCTPLMEAASGGFVKIVKLLLANGAVVNAKSLNGNTPLMYACAGGDVETVKELLKHSADIEAHNKYGHTSLMEAASAGHIKVAKTLIKHGASIFILSNENTLSALMLASDKSDLKMIRLLLEAEMDQENEEKKMYDMHTTLMQASFQGKIEVVKLLIDFGAHVNMINDDYESPLTLAVIGNNVQLVLLLIENGACTEQTNYVGCTPLILAAQMNKKDMVYALLKNGASINPFNNGTEDTSVTLTLDDVDSLEALGDFLIEYCPQFLYEGTTVLIEAAHAGNLNVVRYLLECGANVNAKTIQTGNTALTFACKNGHTEVAKLLIEFGAIIHCRSETGSPLTNACRNGHMSTALLLLSKNANVDY